MYHPNEVAKLTKQVILYSRGLLTAEDLVVQCIDILNDEIRRENAMVMPTNIITFEEAQEQLSIRRNSDWLGLPPS